MCDLCDFDGVLIIYREVNLFSKHMLTNFEIIDESAISV